MLTVMAVSASFVVVAAVSYVYGRKKGAADANKSVNVAMEIMRREGIK
jgi:hypothetical protein